jgi:hypothetical protein
MRVAREKWEQEESARRIQVTVVPAHELLPRKKERS